MLGVSGGERIPGGVAPARRMRGEAQLDVGGEVVDVAIDLGGVDQCVVLADPVGNDGCRGRGLAMGSESWSAAQTLLSAVAVLR